MKAHLTDEQLNAVLLAEEDSSIAAHLSDCAVCRSDVERMRAALDNARAESLSTAERPSEFWREQRRAIASRISAGVELETRPLAWAASLGVLAIVAALLAQGVPPLQLRTNLPVAAGAVATQSDPDHELLVDIGRAMRREVPRALEPASLIAQELHRAASKSDR